MPIGRDLTGKRFFITGATGFLGTALVERILRGLPEADVTVLIRPGRRADAAARLARGAILIHSAAPASFDAPLTQAVEINLLGPARVAAAMAAAGSQAHLISVSTAYVASTHQGEAKEELLSENRFTLDIDWEEEVKAARRLRDDLQAASRRPDRLSPFT